ncbi:hypothetical protein HCTETULN_181 [Candidatus Hodgkinia cicadicola]|nr:hypothetical protein HCTETULN_181 [Candidatus Hodgkinia cicadicola]
MFCFGFVCVGLCVGFCGSFCVLFWGLLGFGFVCKVSLKFKRAPFLNSYCIKLLLLLFCVRVYNFYTPKPQHK